MYSPRLYCSSAERAVGTSQRRVFNRVRRRTRRDGLLWSRLGACRSRSSRSTTPSQEERKVGGGPKASISSSLPRFSSTKGIPDVASLVSSCVLCAFSFLSSWAVFFVLSALLALWFLFLSALLTTRTVSTLKTSPLNISTWPSSISCLQHVVQKFLDSGAFLCILFSCTGGLCRTCHLRLLCHLCPH